MPQQILYPKNSSLLLVAVLGFAALQLSAQPNELPPAVVSAHTIFLENETGFPELQYTAILELNKWGHFDYAESRQKADLVLRLDSGTSAHLIPQGQYPGNASFADNASVPRGHTRIALLDPRTSTTLWSDVHKTEGGKVKNGHLLDGLREAFEIYEKNRSRS